MNQKNRLENLEKKAKKKKEIIFQFDALPSFSNKIELQNYLNEITKELILKESERNNSVTQLVNNSDS